MSIIILTGLPAPLVDVSQGRHFCIRVNLVYGSSEKFSTYDELLNKLRDRGCIINNASACIEVLKT